MFRAAATCLGPNGFSSCENGRRDRGGSGKRLRRNSISRSPTTPQCLFMNMQPAAVLHVAGPPPPLSTCRSPHSCRPASPPAVSQPQGLSSRRSHLLHTPKSCPLEASLCMRCNGHIRQWLSVRALAACQVVTSLLTLPQPRSDSAQPPTAPPLHGTSELDCPGQEVTRCTSTRYLDAISPRVEKCTLASGRGGPKHSCVTSGGSCIARNTFTCAPNVVLSCRVL